MREKRIVGHHEWAFVLVFTATWLLLSISWSNIDFTEKSGAILAGVMDHNFHKLDEQIEQLEKELAEVKARLRMQTSESGPIPGDHLAAGTRIQPLFRRIIGK